MSRCLTDAELENVAERAAEIVLERLGLRPLGDPVEQAVAAFLIDGVSANAVYNALRGRGLPGARRSDVLRRLAEVRRLRDIASDDPSPRNRGGTATAAKLAGDEEIEASCGEVEADDAPSFCRGAGNCGDDA